ncbi:hypothetical protein JCM10450v2_007349 [Rhodotorula kratochvilovae]
MPQARSSTRAPAAPRLPVELVHEAVRQTVAQVDPLDHQWHTLRDLCKVDKYCAEVARPKLYEAAVIYSQRDETLGALRDFLQRMSALVGSDKIDRQGTGGFESTDEEGDDEDLADGEDRQTSSAVLDNAAKRMVAALERSPRTAALLKRLHLYGPFHGAATARAVQRFTKVCPNIEEMHFVHHEQRSMFGAVDDEVDHLDDDYNGFFATLQLQVPNLRVLDTAVFPEIFDRVLQHSHASLHSLDVALATLLSVPTVPRTLTLRFDPELELTRAGWHRARDCTPEEVAERVAAMRRARDGTLADLLKRVPRGVERLHLRWYLGEEGHAVLLPQLADPAWLPELRWLEVAHEFAPAPRENVDDEDAWEDEDEEMEEPEEEDDDEEAAHYKREAELRDQVRAACAKRGIVLSARCTEPSQAVVMEGTVPRAL